MESTVEHYGQRNLTERLLRSFEDAGLDVSRLNQDDIAPMSEFHVMGRAATERLALISGVKPGDRVLDIGCGIGGPARFLASQFECHVTGLDLTPEYIEAARDLSSRTGHASSTEFITADATQLPFPDSEFDLAWSQHCNMNVADKDALLSEIFRTLKPSGVYAFHEIFGESRDAITYPVPWASVPSISHLIPVETARELLLKQGFEIEEWEDLTEESHAWFVRTLKRMDAGQGPPLSLKLLLPEFRTMAGNLTEALGRGALKIVMARVRKRGELNA
jgi:SAM-dependent methyltransferase